LNGELEDFDFITILESDSLSDEGRVEVENIMVKSSPGGPIA
jgi:hypothetical protein